MKANVAYNLFHRALGLSDPQFHNKNIELVKNILQTNNYPISVIRQQMHKSLQKLSQVQPQNTLPPDNSAQMDIPQRRSITFDKTTSNILSNEIRSRSDYKIQVTSKPYQCLRNTVFTQLKTKIETNQRSNIIYKIPCGGNNGTQCNLSYVGQTKNQLKKRLQQHRNDIKAGRNPNGQSAVVTHFTNKGHFPAFNKATVLANEKMWSRRNTMESLHILCEETYNQRRDTQKISASYCALLEKNKNKPGTSSR